MNRHALLFLAFVAAGCGAPDPTRPDSLEQAATDPGDGPGHVHLQRGYAGGGGKGSPLMTFHNGTVLTSNATYAIWWGTSWSSYTGDKITGLETFFTAFGGSRYAQDNDEYSGTNGQVTSSSTFGGTFSDSSAAPPKALSVSGAVAEACKVSNNTPDPNGLYLIYTDTGAGHVNYCAWHSWGNCSNGAPVVTAHELSETITDPRNGGWYDSSNQENGDKCAWTFTGPVTLFDGSVWKLQGLWSNSAYAAGTGYPNLSGQLGCLQGQ
jgi:hypothetical protein